MTTTNLSARFIAGVQCATPDLLQSLAAAILATANEQPGAVGQYWASIAAELRALAWEQMVGGAK